MIIQGYRTYSKYHYIINNFPGGSKVKASASNAGEPGSIPGSGRSPREFLPGKYHGQRNLVGYSSWGYKELNTTEL